MTKKNKIIEETDPCHKILDKIIERKSEQTSALKRLLDELNKDDENASLDQNSK